MPPCDFHCSYRLRVHPTVSILVLVDAALRHGASSATAEAVPSFNPCFSGCRPATLRCGLKRYESHRVSILVLVDAALRLCARDHYFGEISLLWVSFSRFNFLLRFYRTAYKHKNHRKSRNITHRCCGSSSQRI